MQDNVLYVDLDGTLAERQSSFDPLAVGPPVEKMVKAVKAELKKGRTVRLFTARASTMDKAAEKVIKAWLKENGLEALDITCEKKPEMGELWDDRARQVEVNTGNFITKSSARSDRLQRLWLRRGKCPKCGGLPDTLEGLLHGGAGVCSACDHQWLMPGHQEDAVKSAKEIIRKEVQRIEHEEYCPHCEHKFVEKGGPRLKREEGQDWQDAEYECPQCKGEIWMPLPSDEDIERNSSWWGAGQPGYAAKERERRDRKRTAREAKLQQPKQASVKPSDFMNTLQRRAGGVQHLPTTPPAPTEGYRNRDGQVLPKTQTPQSWSPVMALKPAYGDKWDASLQAARDYRAKNPDIKYMSQLTDEALNTPAKVQVNPTLKRGLGWTSPDGSKVELHPGLDATLRHEMRHVTQMQGASLIDRFVNGLGYNAGAAAADPQKALDPEASAGYYSHPLELEARLPELNAAWVRRGGAMPTNQAEAMRVLRHYAPPRSLPDYRGSSETWWGPDYSQTNADQVTPYAPTPAADYKDKELDGVTRDSYQVQPIYDILERMAPDKRQQYLETLAKMLPGLVAAPIPESTVKAASSLTELEDRIKLARCTPPSTFHRPENWDAHDLSPKPDNCTFYSGANDWENGSTWMWVTQKEAPDLHGRLVWVAINNPKGLDDETSVADMQEAKTLGKAAIRTWHQAACNHARKLLPDGAKGPAHPDYADYVTALQDQEMKEFILSSGELEAKPGEKTASILDLEEAKPRTGPAAILHLLKGLDLKSLREQAEKDIKSGKVTRRDKAVKTLHVIDGLTRTGVRPDQLMIKRVPVIPPQFRPFATLGDSLVPGAANELYQDLFRQNDVHRRTLKELGNTGAQLTRINLLNAVRAAYGYGDPVSPKLQGRGTKGFLKQILGESPKFSWVQRKLLSKPMDSVGRGVITVNPDLDMDEISIPEEMAWELYGSHVQRRLVNSTGMPAAQAFKAVADRSTEAKVALKQEMTPGIGRPVIYSRAPAWHKFNTVSGWPKLHEGSNIAINPYVTAGLNADFDGDQCINQLLACIPDKAIAQWRMSYPQIDRHEVKMPQNSKVPAVQDGKLFLFDLEDFPHGDLQHTKQGKNGQIDFHAIPHPIQVVAYDEKINRTVWADVFSWSKHYQREIEIVDTHNGYQLITDDDPRAVYGTKAGELQMQRFTPTEAVNRSVLIPRVKLLPELEVTTRTTPGGCETTYARAHKMPEVLELNAELGWMLGAMCGDGWVIQSKGTIQGFALADNEGYNVHRLKTVLARLFKFGVEPTTIEMAEDEEGRHGATISYRFNSVNIGHWFRDLIGGQRDETTSGSANKHLPPFYLSAPREFRAGLLCGLLDTDGSISVSGGKAKPQLMSSMGSTSVRLSIETKLLAASLGVFSRITPSETPKGKAFWQLTFSAPDLQKYGVPYMVHEVKLKALRSVPLIEDSAVTAKYDIVPVASVTADALAKALGCPKITKEQRKTSSAELEVKKAKQALYMSFAQSRNANHAKFGAISRQQAEEAIRVLGEPRVASLPGGATWLRVVRDEAVTWERVTGIQKTGIKEDGYDLTVPGYETFMSADGVILSNTINVNVPVLPASVEEAKKKLMPSQMRFSIRDQDTVMGSPKHEQVLGTFTASSRPSGKVHQFASRDEAIKAIDRGDVYAHDDVEFPE